jgi:adenylosuccinate synthase
MMKLDVLDGLSEVKVATGYEVDGRTIDELPADIGVLERAQPVYEMLPGWSESTVGRREFQELPAAAQRYVERIAELVGAEIGVVSTGPERLQTIIRARSAIASWFLG